jgi:excisionase family DNA binding protein
VPKSAGGATSHVQSVHPAAPVRRQFATPVLRGLPPLTVVGQERATLLSVRQVAERLQLSTATVYKLCERGELVTVRLGSAIRIRLDDFDLYVRTRRRR